ncbi:hypothetical protein AB395_00006808 (plasmid) [Sinorhizobium fredii CCBAU 45436]|nr:hypothetical protein AB395_00006808 [Sinorhizobium fredii CCBAU 45436]
MKLSHPRAATPAIGARHGHGSVCGPAEHPPRHRRRPAERR